MIKVTDVRKSYGDFEALKGISFEVPNGQIIGLLGPNGAGKTTTMKILTGFMSPSSGSVVIDGIDAYDDPVGVKKRIGYLPESTPLYPDMAVYDYLAYIADMREIPSGNRHQKISEMSRVCGMGAFIGQEIGTLSKGQKQRVGLAQAMIHDPEILILDEPTSGLDPNQIVEIRALIKELGENRTIILSTHNLPEVQQTSGRLLIIHDGRIVADGTPAEIESREVNHASVVFHVGPKPGTDLVPAEIQEKTRAVSGVSRLSNRGQSNGILELVAEGRPGMDIRPDLYRLAVAQEWVIYELRRDALDLEGIFRRLTQIH